MSAQSQSQTIETPNLEDSEGSKKAEGEEIRTVLTNKIFSNETDVERDELLDYISDSGSKLNELVNYAIWDEPFEKYREDPRFVYSSAMDDLWAIEDALESGEGLDGFDPARDYYLNDLPDMNPEQLVKLTERVYREFLDEYLDSY